MNKHTDRPAVWLALCWFLICSSAVYAQVQEQVVSLELENVSLKDVFSHIENQTTYRFSYRDVLVDNRADISISCEQAPVGPVLNEVLSGRNLEYSIVSSRSIVISDKQSPAAGNPGSRRKVISGSIAGVSIQQTSTAPGKGAHIRIRGVRSLSASNDPLLIVDGIPFAGTLNDLAPDDIKSVDILKDASSTAIYGSRGANGVILVTTSRGAGYIKPQLSYNGYYGIGNVAGKYQVFDAGEFVRYREISQYQPGSPWLAQEQPYFETGRSYDWQDELYQTAMVTNHDVNLRAGKDFMAGSMGLSYYNETSPIPGQEFTRYSLRGNLDLQMNKWLKAGMSTQNSFGLTDGEGIDIMVLAELLTFSPLVNPYDERGNVVTQPLAPREDSYSPLLIRDRELWTQERQPIPICTTTLWRTCSISTKPSPGNTRWALR